MDRRRRKVPRKNQLCLRLNDRQLHLLRRYMSFREFTSEVDALRQIVDGLESWLSREEAKKRSKEAQKEVGPAPTSEAGDAPRAPANDVDDDGTSLGDFGGQPRLKLPGLPGDDDLS
jgi:hypothetical protein